MNLVCLEKKILSEKVYFNRPKSFQIKENFIILKGEQGKKMAQRSEYGKNKMQNKVSRGEKVTG